MVPTVTEFDEIRFSQDWLNRFLLFFRTKMVKNIRSWVEITGFYQSYAANSFQWYIGKVYLERSDFTIGPAQHIASCLEKGALVTQRSLINLIAIVSG